MRRYKSTGPVYPLLAGELGVAKFARQNQFQLTLLTFADMVPNLSSGRLGIHFNLETSVSLLCMRERVLAKEDDPKVEQLTSLQTEFYLFLPHILFTAELTTADNQHVTLSVHSKLRM